MTLPPFQSLVDAHWRDVARLAHALAGPDHGDDVAQQAWVQALAAYPRANANNLRSWLFTITRHCAMDVHRRTARTQPHDDPTSLTGSPVGAATPTPPTEPPDAALWRLVAALPERHREAVVLKYVGDLDHREIAAMLGTTPAMSRRLVSDALAALRTTRAAAGPPTSRT